MDSSLPTVLIYGVDNFVARKLAKEILKKEMNVVGVGSWVVGLGDLANFSYVSDVTEIDSSFAYLFDFVGSELVWKKASKIGAKVTVVCSNDRDRATLIRNNLKKMEANWRMVEAVGVYGPGMRSRGFLAEAIIKAVKNKNLVLPSLETEFRLLAVDDLVEVIMRATFLSGTEKEVFFVAGGETNSREVAEVLIEEAKMTRHKVMGVRDPVDVWDKNEVMENWEKLRWKPSLSFREGLGETLQYFFSKVDEESRKGIAREDVEVVTGWRKMKVVVTPLDSSDATVGTSSGVGEPGNKSLMDLNVVNDEERGISNVVKVAKKKTKSKKKLVVKKKKRRDRIKEVVVKNSNSRPVVVEEEVVDVEEEVAVVEVPNEVKVTKKKRWFRWGREAKIGLGAVMVLMVIMPIVWVRNGWLIYKSVEKAGLAIREQEYEKAEKIAEQSIKKIKKIDKQIDNWGLNKVALFRNYQTLLRVGEDVLELEMEVVDLVEVGEKISGAVLGETEVDWEVELPKLKEGLVLMSARMGGLQARLNGDWGWLPARWKSWPNKGIVELGKVRETMDLAVKGVEILPEFLGTDGKRREYLVLLQNETELRPGGGFIGSFGILSFEGGHLLNFEVKDVYEADGQLKGHVEPPEEIKAHLGEAGWYLRDANWDADFGLVSEKVQWFLQKELGREVDGVIGINLAVAKGALGAIGEVYVPDFDEKVNEDNLYEQAQFWSETKFFPGSNQKASFLGGLSGQMFEELRDLSTEKRLTLMETTIDLLEKNEIQMSLEEEEVAERLAGLGWDGAMWSGGCGVDRCLADYLYVVEANVGVNKANYFLYRNIEQLVDISERSVARVLKVNYENTAKNDNWPGGDYKNYMRVYLPVDINLAQVVLMDGNNTASKKVYSRDELKIRQVGNKKEIGFLMTVPVGEKRIVEIRYSSQINLAGSDKFSYLHFVQKQSGFGDTGMVTLVSIMEGWQPLQVEPVASVVASKLLFNQKLDKDIRMGVELSR